MPRKRKRPLVGLTPNADWRGERGFGSHSLKNFRTLFTTIEFHARK